MNRASAKRASVPRRNSGVIRRVVAYRRFGSATATLIVQKTAPTRIQQSDAVRVWRLKNHVRLAIRMNSAV